MSDYFSRQGTTAAREIAVQRHRHRRYLERAAEERGSSRRRRLAGVAVWLGDAAEARERLAIALRMAGQP